MNTPVHPRMPRRSRRGRAQPLRRRLVALVLGFMALGLLTAHVGTDWALKAFLVDRVDRQLDLAGRVCDRYIVEVGPGLPVFGAGTESQAWEFLYSAGLQLSFLQTRDTGNHIVQTLGQPDGGPVLPAVLPLGGEGIDRPAYFDAPAEHGGSEYRVRTARFPNGVGTYAIAMPLDDVNATMRRLIVIEAILSAIFLAVLGAFAVRAVRRALRPLQAIEREAGEVGAGDLARRVAVADERTEVGRLGLALNAMLDQLERAFAERQASEERLRRFVADASHELRTPLASIQGYAELFRRGAADRPEDLAKAMSRIESEAARMGVLVDELLLLARLDSGRPLVRQPVDIAALAVEAVEDARVVDPARSWTVEVPGGGDGWMVSGDGDRLRQVLGNLLANVRAHTPPGTAATVRVGRDAGAVVVEVHDDGPGMAPESARRAFDRFYRSDSSRRRDPAGRIGSGLGLAIADAVVRAHGGVIGLESVPGVGTTVRLALPPEAAAPPPVDTPSVDASSAGVPLAAAGAPEAASDGPDEAVSEVVPAREAHPTGGRPPELTADTQPSHRGVAGRAGLMRTTRTADRPPEGTDPAPAGAGRGRQGAAMDRLARWVTARRRLVVILWAVVFVAGGFASSTISHHLSQRFDMPGQAAFEANQTIQQLYGNGGGSAPLIVALTAPAGSRIDAPTASGVVRATADGLAAIPGARVASPADPGGAALISADHTTAAVLLFGRTAVGAQGPDVSGEVAAAHAVLARTLPPGWQGGVTGEDALASGGGSQAGNGVLTEALLGALGALAVLAFVFGSLLALMPLVIAAVSVLASFLMVLGVTYLTDVSFIVQFLIGVIGLGVAIDYSLLMVTRWREERTHGSDNAEAIVTAMATAGRAVAFSGVTVAIGLVALVVLPLPFMRSIGIGGMLIPLVSVVASLTLLPALLAMAGPRMDWPRRRRDAAASRGWTAWARLVVRRRWAAAALSLAALVALGVAGLGMRVGEPPAATQARSGSAFAGLAQLEHHGLAGGVLTPVEALVPAGTDPGAVARALAGTDGVRAVLMPAGSAWHRGGSAVVSVVPRDESYTSAGSGQAGAIRDTLTAHVPDVAVGGVGPAQIDAVHAIYGRFPLMLGIIAAVTFLLLMRAFRSVLLPLKAVVLNLLSVGAAYGVLRLVWQDGHGSAQIWGTPATGAITFWVPLMVFAFLYGLSMDYEVFILARMREEYDRTGSTSVAVTEGLGRTGRLVTSAALILFLTFASLASAPVTDLRIFATGLGAGILLDATVVRALLVPALVSLFGRWNWWLPRWAGRLLRVPPSPARTEAVAHPQAEPSATR